MELQDWKFIQNNADSILIGGISSLESQPIIKKDNIFFNGPGNYLILLNEKPMYIGEGKILSKRLKQQFNPKTSTFYKNYSRSVSQINQPIDSFNVKIIETKIGRKEIEEMGSKNFGTTLNRFQLNKRSKYDLVENNY